jgi:hypothetical protein
VKVGRRVCVVVKLCEQRKSESLLESWYVNRQMQAVKKPSSLRTGRRVGARVGLRVGVRVGTRVGRRVGVRVGLGCVSRASYG